MGPLLHGVEGFLKAGVLGSDRALSIVYRFLSRV